METKTCRACRIEKPITDFYKEGTRHGKPKHQARCKPCYNAAKKPTPRRAFGTKRGTFTPNRYRVEGDTAYIELTDRADTTLAEAIISATDLDRVIAAGRWHVSPRRHTSYVARSHREGGKPGMEWLHRFVCPAPADREIDHINHDGMDNRRENLRAVTRYQNQQNRKPRPPIAQSGVPNVCRDNRHSKWFVAFQRNGARSYHGYFDTVEAAAKVAEEVRAALADTPRIAAGSPDASASVNRGELSTPASKTSAEGHQKTFDFFCQNA